MNVKLISTPNGIDTLEGAKKYCQDFARICYSEKDFDDFKMGLYFDGLPKAMEIVFNNEVPNTTAEKSARYTVMKDIPADQKVLYDKWKGIFVKEIDKIYPKSIVGRHAKINKLAQENARYVTSVFTPTKMGYTMSLRQMNILASEFEKFGNGLGVFSEEFKDRLFYEGMVPFLESDIVQRFRIPGLEDKAHKGVKLFGDRVEENFGEDVYSTNLRMSFACLAQNHRHRTIHNHIIDGWRENIQEDYFIPPIILDNKKLSDEWRSDLDSIAEEDFPQAQIIDVAERGNREDLEMKLRELNCGLAQLEIVRVMDDLLEKYSVYVPEMEGLRGATCVTSGEGCNKGGCAFGAARAIVRSI